MRIIDKNRDYYDFYGRIIDDTDNPVFDRRGSVVIHDDSSLVKLEDYYCFSEKPADCEDFFVLITGNTRYIFKCAYRVYQDRYTSSIIDSYSIDISLYRKFTNISLSEYSTSNGSFSETYYMLYAARVFLPLNISYSFKQKRDTMLLSLPYKDIVHIDYVPKAVNMPILKNTSIAGIIKPADIWKDIENYLITIQDDKDRTEVSDKENIINHGFDVKTSFRNSK